MKVKFTFILIAITLLISATAFSQNKDFRFRRKINSPDSTGWYALTLPPALFRHVSSSFSDLRILQVNEKDTVEIPYLLKVLEDETIQENVELPAFNQSKKGNKLYSSFELPKAQKVNRLDLDFSEPDFNGYVTIEGSADQREWFEIAKSQRIASITKEGTRLTATYVNFPLINYRYLRIGIEADRPLDFPNASFKKLQTKEGRTHDIPLAYKETQNKAIKQTTIDMPLKNLQKIARVFINIESDENYYRSFQIDQLKDSSKTPKGWEYYYEPVYSGLLTSFNKNEFDLIAFTDKLRITVYNGDNMPLKVKGIRASGPDIELTTRLTAGNNYLYYGNSLISTPSYDLEHFTEKIPGHLTPVTLSDEEKLTKEVAPTPPLLESKIWLWLVMAIVIGVLGFFTLRMMKSN